MNKKQKEKQTQHVFPNIYGRKPSKLITGSNAEVSNRQLGNYPSRRKARMDRANVCATFQLKTYQTIIVADGEQISDAVITNGVSGRKEDGKAKGKKRVESDIAA